MKQFVKKWIGKAALSWLALAIVAGVGLYVFSRKPLEEYARGTLVRVVKERFGCDAEVATLKIVVFPRFHITGTELILRMNDRLDVPPLIQVREFELDGSILKVVRRAPEFEMLKMDGLVIQIPPREKAEGAPKIGNQTRSRIEFTIQEVNSKDAELNILGNGSDKPKLTFEIHALQMKHFRPDGSATFHASLTNPRPVGEIMSDGEFGPWNTDDPSQSPVKGEFEFSHADLATLKGISGMLSSKGEYDGVLDTISVQGETQTPDFSIAVSGHTFPLSTEYDAVVDGTKGNVTLKSVHVHFLHTSLVASGTIAKQAGEADRKILLDVHSESARVEDLLRLAVKSSKPLLTGSANLKTSFDLRLHRGETTISRMELAGHFGVDGAEFTSKDVQEKIDSLSRHGRGEPNSTDDSPAVSALKGDFKLRDGVINFSQLSFGVQGAEVQLTGSYGLRDEALDFHGTLQLQAKLSQTTTGVKSFFLSLIDPLFEKEGHGAVVPIRIGGTRTDPLIGLDLHRKKTQN